MLEIGQFALYGTTKNIPLFEKIDKYITGKEMKIAKICDTR